MRDGSTPSIQMGGAKTLLHPAGSHENGKDIDISYLKRTGLGEESGTSGMDMEKNFWFMYSILQSTSVDLVITAYKDDYVAIARDLYQRGIISDLAVGRFNSLVDDSSLNHDKHMHVTVTNMANRYVSRKFKPADDVYNCYLSLRPNQQGGNLNYCE
jgi:hypothetical protein